MTLPARQAVVWGGLLLLAAALYLPRLNGDWYYLYGEEATGLTLVMSLASGQGYHDISLPGAPPHVREPFLFYFLVSLLDRVFGLNLWVFKGLVALAAMLTGPAAYWLFRKLALPRIAFLAALLTLAAPFAVDYAALFRPDPLANLLFLTTLALLETYRAQDRPLTRAALLAAVSLLAAYLVRSTALAIALAWPLALALPPGLRARLSPNFKKALIILIPFALGFGLWEHRNQVEAAHSGLTYSGRYLLGAQPDSLTIMAEDFHAPLHPPWPRADAGQILDRVREQLFYYAGQTFQFCINLGAGPHSRAWLWPAAIIFFALVLIGYLGREGPRRSVSALSLPIYLLAIAAWPMQAPRQAFLLAPFLWLYALLGLDWVLERVRGRPWRAPVTLAALALLAVFLVADVGIVRQGWRVRHLPRLEISPGLHARILSPASLDSARTLLWARDHTPPDAALMFHSPPPCYLVTRRQCSSIPFEADPQKVRDYLVQGPVDYVIVDDWATEFPGGPGEFMDRFLLPALQGFPQDFERVYQPGPSPAGVYRVRKTL